MSVAKKVMNLEDALTTYSMICNILEQQGGVILKSGKPYSELSDNEIGVVIRHIVVTSTSRSEVHSRIIRELKTDNNFSILSCSPGPHQSKKACLAKGALRTKDGTTVVVTINSPNGPKGHMVVI